MNQRDATVAVISYFRERSEGAQACSEDKTLERAVRVLEKRADVLRVRLERRRALPPDDIMAQPLTFDKAHILEVFRGNRCPICEFDKDSRNAMCRRCFDRLDPSLRRAFSYGTSFFHAYCRAYEILKPASAI